MIFCFNVVQLLDQYCPLRVSRLVDKQFIYPSYIQNLISHKFKMYRILKDNKCLYSKEYIHICKTIKHLVNRYKSRKINFIVNSSHKMFNYMSKFTKSHTPISYLRTNNSVIFEDDKKCEFFAKISAESYSNVPDFNPPLISTTNIDNPLNDIEINLLKVDQILKSLPNNNCAAEDCKLQNS